MVNAVSAVSSAQNSTQNTGVQSSAPATPAPPPPLSSIDFVVSGIYVNNLQNVAILEYRSSQTDQVLQQYPNQAQINAFKAAQRLAEQASTQHPSAPADVHQAVAPQTQDEVHTETHVSVPATTSSQDTSSDSPEVSSGGTDSSSGKTTSVVA